MRRELKNLVELGIVLEVEGKIIKDEKDETVKKRGDDKKKFYKADPYFAFFSELRGIMKKSSVMVNKAFVQQLSKKGKIDLLLLTGKFIDREDIPSDILIVGEIENKDIQKAVEEFEVEIGQEINYTYMPREEFTYRREVADRFLESLLDSEKILLTNTIDPGV